VSQIADTSGQIPRCKPGEAAIEPRSRAGAHQTRSRD
jgi:hypothetical protein